MAHRLLAFIFERLSEQRFHKLIDDLSMGFHRVCPEFEKRPVLPSLEAKSTLLLCRCECLDESIRRVVDEMGVVGKRRSSGVRETRRSRVHVFSKEVFGSGIQGEASDDILYEG